MTLAWKDISTRVPRSAYELRHAGLVIVITNAHIDCPGDWLLRAPPLVPDRVLTGIPKEDYKGAMRVATDIVWKKAHTMSVELERLYEELER